MADRDEAGRFVKGNQLFKVAKERAEKNGNKLGRPRAYKDPEAMLQDAMDFFQWCEDNPLPEEKLFHAQGVVTRDTIYHKRPYTYNGFYVYNNINENTFREYKSRPEFSWVIKLIDDTMREQKFSGAAAGFFNANIIARDLGLRDAQDVDQKVSGSMEHTHDHGALGSAVVDALAKKYGKDKEGE